MIHCEKYSCTLAAEACASRYLNAQSGAKEPCGNMRPGKFDENCLACDAGKDRLKTIGKAGVVSYRKMLAGVRDAARVRAMAATRRKRGRG